MVVFVVVHKLASVEDTAEGKTVARKSASVVDSSSGVSSAARNLASLVDTLAAPVDSSSEAWAAALRTSDKVSVDKVDSGDISAGTWVGSKALGMEVVGTLVDKVVGTEVGTLVDTEVGTLVDTEVGTEVVGTLVGMEAVDTVVGTEVVGTEVGTLVDTEVGTLVDREVAGISISYSTATRLSSEGSRGVVYAWGRSRWSRASTGAHRRRLIAAAAPRSSVADNCCCSCASRPRGTPDKPSGYSAAPLLVAYDRGKMIVSAARNKTTTTTLRRGTPAFSHSTTISTYYNALARL